MDDAVGAIAQLKDEVQILRQRNAELEAAAVEHQRIANALQLSEARFRLLVEQFPLSTQIFAPDGRTVQVNRAWEQLWGVTLDQIRDYNVLHDPQLVTKGIMPYIQRGFAGEAVAIPPILYNPDETLPHRTQHADPRRWVRAFIYPVKDQSGRLREVVLIHEDITERQQAEEALRNSEARYRTLFENFPNGSVFLFDKDLRYTLASGTGLAANGLAPHMFEGKTIWEIFPPEVAARDEPFLRAALRGERTRVEVSFGPKTFVVHTLPVKDERDMIVGGMVMTQDITERKLAEERVRFVAEASALLSASFNYEATFQGVARLAIPLLADVCAVFIVGTDGTIQLVAATHVDPEQEEALRTMHEPPPLDRTAQHPAAMAIRTGQPVINAATSAASMDVVGQDVVQRGTACGMIAPAHVIMPLVAREHVLGAIAFGRNAPDRGYDAAELQLAEEIARRGASGGPRAPLPCGAGRAPYA